MVVNYFGEGCFRLQSGEVSLLVDPANNRLKGDVVLKTVSEGNLSDLSSNEISFPGEYEMRGLEIQGWAASESTEKLLKNVFLVKWEDISLAFLGQISKAPDPEIMERIGEPNVLFLPFDGEKFLSSELASKIIKQLSPNFIITSFSKNPGALLKALGQKAEPQDKLVFKKKDLAAEQGRLVILEGAKG